MRIEFTPIGYAHTGQEQIPRHWTVSELEGTLVIDQQYLEGMRDIQAGQKIVVLFHFHLSPPFDAVNYLVQTPPHHGKRRGVFSTCSPHRPNPIGMSVLDVVDVKGNIIYVKKMDMMDNTPILDIKPYVESDQDERR